MKWRALLLCLLAALLLASPVLADDLQMLASQPLGDNESEARELAVDRALRQSVVQIAVGLIDPATMKARLADFDQKILAKAKQFVTTYKLEASAKDDKKMVVLVAVSLDRAALEKALTLAGLRIDTGHLGRTLVLVSEENSPGRPPLYWWSGYGQDQGGPEVVLEVMNSLGMKITAVGALQQQLDEQLRQPVLTRQQALELARQAGSEMVVLGTVRTFPLVTAPEDTPLPLVQLTALDAATGQELAMVEAEGPVYNDTPPPEATAQVVQAVQEAVREMVAKASAAKPVPVDAGGKVELQVEGVRSLGDLRQLEQTVSGLTGQVSDLRRQSLGRGKARYTLQLSGPVSRLADEMLVQDYGTFLLNVVEASGGVLRVVIIPKR